ncbi:ribonuclease III domain-containing protein [Aspergillus egyptiacus]|nr:ribonuclease III domain-containing protein [Aspergillus egyptiacus]
MAAKQLVPRSVVFDALPSVLRASDEFNPWTAWDFSASTDIYQTRIHMQRDGDPSSAVFINMVTPMVLPTPVLEPIRICWDRRTTYVLSFRESENVSGVSLSTIKTMRWTTSLYLQTLGCEYTHDEQDSILLFSPDLPHNTLEDFASKYSGSEAAVQAHARGAAAPNIGVVRDCSRYGEPLLFRKWIYSGNGISLEGEKLSQRKNHLKNILETSEESPHPLPGVRVVPAHACTVDKLPFAQSIFGLFIPALVDTLERRLIATKLCTIALKDVGFASLERVQTALTTPYTRSRTHYQRYEFFGDSILKYIVSCQLFFQHPDWQEGDLTRARDEMIQNPRLARAALRLELDAFIIERRFNVRKWVPPSIARTRQFSGRDMSAKVLADVVEALIGAAYVDGGISRARACVYELLPETAVQNESLLERQVPQSFVRAENDFGLEIPLDSIQKSLGYHFKNQSLLSEALTHPSCARDAMHSSYQRLEFLGDAVLDMIIVDYLIRHPVEIPQGEMTMIKQALCNQNLLAFFCLEFTACETKSDAQSQQPRGLWRFMRSMNPSLQSSQQAVISRYLYLRETTSSSLQRGNKYPWQELSELNAEKYFSDLVESILGAVFVDSRGDVSVCERYLEAIGLSGYLRRVLNGGVDVAHPKNVLQRVSRSLARFTLERLETNAGDATYECIISIHGTRVASVGGCLCREEAEIKAANAAIDFLEESSLDMLVTGKACI